MFKPIVVLLIMCIGFNFTLAQQKLFEGRWYLGFRDMVKVEQGIGCVFAIQRASDGAYSLAYTGKNCTGSVPPEGRYTRLDNALTNGDWTLEANHISITTTYSDLYTEFRPVVTDSIVGALIAKAANNIDSATVKKPYRVALLHSSISTMKKALQIDSRCVVCMVNAAIASLHLEQLDSAAFYYSSGYSIDSSNPHLPDLKEALRDRILLIAWEKYGKKGLLQQAIEYYKKGLKIDPLYPETYYNIGGAYYTLGNYKEAKKYFEKTLLLKPAHEQARHGLDAASDALNEK
jgi:tetratricopeptide (TPR) repeat protein